MSDFVKVLNRIKASCSKEWLTPSQEIIFEECQKLPRSYYMINIYGKSGVGKTFLCWILTKEGLGTYFTSYRKYIEADDATTNLVLDNCESDRIFARNLRNIGLRKNIRSIFFITNTRANDDLPSLELKLTEEDIKCVKANLWRCNITIKNNQEVTNLKELIKMAEVK